MLARRQWLLGVLSVSLAGCGIGSVAPAPTELDLGTPASLSSSNVELASWRFQAIALPAFHQARQLAFEDVIWRLGVSGQPNRYATYRWSASPARLVHERLFERLSLYGAVLPESINADMPQLQVTLMQFEQVYAPDGTGNEGMVSLQAVLVRDGRVQGQFLGAERERAQENTAPAGALALRVATDRLLERLLQWLAKEVN